MQSIHRSPSFVEFRTVHGYNSPVCSPHCGNTFPNCCCVCYCVDCEFPSTRSRIFWPRTCSPDSRFSPSCLRCCCHILPSFSLPRNSPPWKTNCCSASFRGSQRTVFEWPESHKNNHCHSGCSGDFLRPNVRLSCIFVKIRQPYFFKRCLPLSIVHRHFSNV